MAADPVSMPKSANPCCVDLMNRYLKLEGKRNIIRKGMEEIDSQSKKLISENRELKKAYEEERMRGELEKEVKEKESSIRKKLENEIHDLKAEISSFQKSGCLISVTEDANMLLETRILEGEAEIKRLTELLEKEKRRADTEKKKAESEKKKAAEAWKLIKMEKSKAEEERRHAENEKNKANELMLCLDKLKKAEEERRHAENEARVNLIAERSKADDANKKVETEKQKTNREKKRADAEKAKAEELMRLVEVERKEAMAGKVCEDNLSRQLEEEKQRREELQMQVEELISGGRGRRDFSCFRGGRCDDSENIETADVKFLREQLKFEKKQVKLAKKLAKLEKSEKSLLKQELHLLKQDFNQFSCRLSMLDGRLSRSIEGTDDLAKIGDISNLWGFNMQSKFFGIKPCDFNSQSDFGFPKAGCTDSFMNPGSTREYTGLPLSGGSCTRPLSGIISEMESPVGGSLRNKSQNSAVCSTTTSFSDRKFMGSQGGDAFVNTTLAKLAEKKNQRPTISKLSGKRAKRRQNENMAVVEENIDRSIQRNVENACLNSFVYDGLEVADRVCGHGRKKRKTQGALESAQYAYSEDNQLYLVKGDELSMLKDPLSIKDGLPTIRCSRTCGISKPSDDGIVLQKKRYDMYRNCKSNRNTKTDKQKTSDLQPFGPKDNQKQAGKLGNEGTREPCFLPETAAPAQQMRKNVYACMEEPSNAVGSDRAALICFENMICGDVLKLLDLDSGADERMFKAAVEMPLSPTLPEIQFPSPLYGEDDSYDLVEGLIRKSETERDNWMSMDVIDLEINSNRLNLKTANTLEHSVFLHSSEASGNNVVKLHSPHGIGHNSSFLGNGIYLDGEQMCNAKESNYMNNIELAPSITESKGHDQQAKPLSHCWLDHTSIPNSRTCNDAVSGETDNPLLLGQIICSFSKSTLEPILLHEDAHFRCCSQEFCNLGKNTFPLINGPNETFQTTQVTNSDLSENQVQDGEGKELDDLIVAQSIYHETLESKTRKRMDGENNVLSADKTSQTGIHRLSESSGETRASEQLPSSTMRKLVDPCRTNDSRRLQRIPKYFIVFSNTKCEDSIFRIIHAMNTIHQSIMVSQADCMVATVLHALSLELDLLPEEKVSVFLSLLLCNISGMTSVDSKSFFNRDVILRSVSFAGDISKVISDGETRCLFLEICHLDNLLSLIEDLLIGREVLMFTDGLHEPLSPCESSHKFYRLDGRNMSVSTRAATSDQLLAASCILASLCAAVDHISFLLEASYKILRMCRNDTSWILSALHIFASVAGEKFFTLDNYGFLIAAIKSVVFLLEKGHESVSSLSSCLHSVCDVGLSFPLCEQCPFAIDVVCVDEVIPLLLGVLQDYALTGRLQNANKSIVSSICTVPTCFEIDDGSTACKKELDGLTIDCDVSCSLFNHRKHATDHSGCIAEKTFCFFTDTVSLVELIGCYMRWEWTCNKLVPSLLQILESCVSEEYSAALIVLIGQLGRFGVDTGGYEQSGIAELRCSLVIFLDTNITGRRGLPIQFAAVGALLNLLPLNLGAIVEGCLELSVPTSQSDHVRLIKKWFSQLSSDQQSLSLRLYRDADVQKHDVF